MKKLIGAIAVLLTLLFTGIYRQLTHHHIKVKPDTVYAPRVLHDGMLLTALLMQ